MGITAEALFESVGRGVDRLILDHRARYEARSTEAALRDPTRVQEGFQISRSVRDPKARWVDGTPENSFAIFGYNYVSAAFTFVSAIIFHFLPFGLALTGDRVAIVTVAIIILTRVILFAAIGYRLDNAVLGHPLMIGVWCWILLRSVWFTGIRKQLHWRGRTYDAGNTKFGAD